MTEILDTYQGTREALYQAIDILPSSSDIICLVVTPHAQRERGKVIDRGVHIYICLWSEKKFESYFRDRLTFSNIDSRTSRFID